jgi:hypothetical protein
MEDLPIIYIQLRLVRVIFVNWCTGRYLPQGRDAQDMIRVPMRDQGLADGSIFYLEEVGQGLLPGWEALGCVYEYPLRPGADEICVCAWKGILSIRSYNQRYG